MPDIHQILSKSGLKTHADPEFKHHSRCTEPAYHSFANANPTPKDHDQHDSSKDSHSLYLGRWMHGWVDAWMYG